MLQRITTVIARPLHRFLIRTHRVIALPVLILASLYTNVLFAQYESGLIPYIMVKSKINKKYSFAFALQNEMQKDYQSPEDKEKIPPVAPEKLALKKLDLQSILTYKASKSIALTLGFTIRVREPASQKGSEWRGIQVVTHSFKKSKYKFKSEFKFEQRYDKTSQELEYGFAFRTRYKFSMVMPLSKLLFPTRQLQRKGYKPYAKLNANFATEFLFTPTLQDAFQQFGNRYYAGIAYQAYKNVKILLGYEFRIKNFLTKNHGESGFGRLSVVFDG